MESMTHGFTGMPERSAISDHIDRLELAASSLARKIEELEDLVTRKLQGGTA